MKRTVWNFAGSELRLPGGVGRLERRPLDNGLTLYRAEFRVRETCIVEAEYDYAAPLLGAATHLAGRSVVETADGDRFGVGPDQALFSRVSRAGTRILIPGGQTLRHVGVTIEVEPLIRRLGGRLPEALACFEQEPDDGLVIRPFATSSRLRRLQTQLFTAEVEGVTAPLVLEGLASQILGELIQSFMQLPGTGRWAPSVAERAAVEQAVALLRADLARPHSAGALAQAVGLSRGRLLTLFRICKQGSLADFLRRERLERARQLLEDGDLPVKIVAGRVGYRHLSNFSLAYRRHFGETPGRARRRAVAERSV